MIEQVMHRMGKAARQQLLLQIYREKSRTGIDVFVARHAGSLIQSLNWSLIMTNRSPQNTDFCRFFYTLVEAVEKLVFGANAKLTMKSTLQNAPESTISASGRVNGPRYLHRVLKNRVFLHPR